MIISTAPRARNLVRPLRGSARRLRGLGALAPTTFGYNLAPPPGAVKVADSGELVNLSAAATVYYGSPNAVTGRVFAPGGTRCVVSNFYNNVTGSGGSCFTLESEASPWAQPTSYLPGGHPERGQSLATRVADQGQPFRMTSPGTVYYGTPYEAWNQGKPQRYMVHDMLPGDYMCDNDPFGPDPISGVKKACYVVPHLAPEVAAPITYDQRLAAQQAAEERATAATQAQQDVFAAQLAIQQQQADAQAQLAQLARNAASQQQAAQASAEVYRQMQEAAQKQAADMAAQLAKIAAANTADQMAAEAAANVAAQAESIRQATEAARAAENDRARATLAAQAAALNAVQTQQQYEAQLAATQNAAATQAGLTAAGATGGVMAGGFDWKNIALFGGLGVAAMFVLMSD